MKWIRGIFLGVLLLSLFTGSVFAIGDPEGGVSNLDTYVFRDVLSSGDQLYYIRYCVNFTSAPSERAIDTWQMALYDYLGNLVATRPLNYFGENIISIYLTPSQALSWGYAHQVKIEGMPSIYGNLTEGVNMVSYNLSVYDYKEGTALADTMLAQAAILQTDLGLTLLSTGRLAAIGSQIFQLAIPNLTYMVPTIFLEATDIIAPDWNTNYSTAYSDSLRVNEGTSLTEAITSIGSIFRIPHDWMAFWMIIIGMLSLVGIVVAGAGSGGSPSWGLVVGYAFLAGVSWFIGGAVFILVCIIPVILAVIFGIYFIVGRFA